MLTTQYETMHTLTVTCFCILCFVFGGRHLNEGRLLNVRQLLSNELKKIICEDILLSGR